MSYSDYLHLERVLDAQEPLSDAHDELLFIIQHQTSELWMKLAIHEIRSRHQGDPPRPVAARLQDAVARRPHLRAAQYRLGRAAHDDAERIHRVSRPARPILGFSVLPIPRDRIPRRQPQPRDACARTPTAPTSSAKLEEILAAPSLYDEALLLLARNGFDIGEDARRTDWRVEAHGKRRGAGAWKTVYASPAKHWMLYELAEKLVDFEDYFRRWRFNHVTTVERIIGLKRGTGGTVGRLLLAQDARGRAVPGTLEAENRALTHR